MLGGPSSGWPEHRQRCTGPRGRPGTELSTERTADDDLVSQEKWGLTDLWL